MSEKFVHWMLFVCLNRVMMTLLPQISSLIAKVRTVANALICRLAPDITWQLFLSSQQMLYSELNGKKAQRFCNPHLQTSIHKQVGKFNLKLNATLSAHLVMHVKQHGNWGSFITNVFSVIYWYLLFSVAATVGRRFVAYQSFIRSQSQRNTYS